MKIVYALILSLVSSSAFAEIKNFRPGRTTSTENKSIQSQCPDAVLYDNEQIEIGLELYLPPLRERTWSKAQLDNVLASLEKCVDPRSGSFVRVILGNDEKAPPFSLSHAVYENLVCRTNLQGSPLFNYALKKEEAVLEVYRCHQNANWPTATDGAGTRNRTRSEAPDSSAQNRSQSSNVSDQASGESRNANVKTGDPADRVRDCGREADVMNLKSNARIDFVRNCYLRSERSAEEKSNDGRGARSKSATANRTSCAQVENISPHHWAAVNRCKDEVMVQFCYENPDPQSWASKLKCSENNYGTAGPIPPGRKETVSSPGVSKQKAISFACAINVDGQPFLAFLSNEGKKGRCE